MTTEPKDESKSRELQVITEPAKTNDIAHLVATHKNPMQLARALVVVSGNSVVVLADADSRRRDIGLWLGAGFTALFFVSGIVVSLSSAPAALAATCFGFATTSLGAMFAVITDKFKSSDKKSEPQPKEKKE